MKRSITSVGIVGAGTMGAGIAGVCAAAGLPAVLLDLDKDAAGNAVARLTGGRKPVLSAEQAELISCGALEDGVQQLADVDWICEAIVENLDAKRDLFEKLESVRKDGSIITSNTSGIPLRDICQGMPERFNRDVAITHFFNPVHIMRLLELIPGEYTDPDVTLSLADFFGGTLNKGVVYAKDTVNFIGNRIGCFWILAGLHKGLEAQQQGISMETIDALMSKPMGLPPTGLYGLVDLIGLDIMDSVAKNLQENLPQGDPGFNYLQFPAAESAMIERGQLGRKSGGGYYRMTRHDDGSKSLHVFDLPGGQWRDAVQAEQLDEQHASYQTLTLQDTAEGRFAWQLMSETLCYAADLVPDIADDIVNIDRAMRWGFNWAQGPFEMLDGIGAATFTARLRDEGRSVPKMLALLEKSGAEKFYQDGRFFALDGQYQALPAE